MSLKNSIKPTNKLDENLQIVGLKDDQKNTHLDNETRIVNKVEDKNIKKTVRLSLEVPFKTHTKFALLCKINETSMQKQGLELLENFIKNQVITFDE